MINILYFIPSKRVILLLLSSEKTDILSWYANRDYRIRREEFPYSSAIGIIVFFALLFRLIIAASYINSYDTEWNLMWGVMWNSWIIRRSTCTRCIMSAGWLLCLP